MPQCQQVYGDSKFNEELALTKEKLLLLGDFNYHVDNTKCHNVNKFTGILSSMNLVQHVNIPTHTEGHTLGFIVTKNGELSIKNLKPDMSILCMV